MKTEVLHSLLVARTLYDQARVLLYTDNKYSASAALVILQDAFELIMKAALIEKGVDETRSIEQESFDGILKLLQNSGVTVGRSGTLKAMNRERVIVKHYGHLAEQETVRNFFDTAEVASRAIMEQVFGKSLNEISASDLIQNVEIRSYLAGAESFIAKSDPFNAMLSVRKAIFVSIEADYDVSIYADPTMVDNWLAMFSRGRWAPYHTKNADWIKDHVKEPFDYIQLNHEKIKIDLIEWGVNTQDFWNIWRLTPRVYKPDKSEIWQISSANLHNDHKLDMDNARYCLERGMNLILKKQQHQAVTRYVPWAAPTMEFLIIRDCPRLLKADSSSEVLGTLKAGERVVFSRWRNGLDGRDYYQIPGDYSRVDWPTCYVDATHCQVGH